jgi:hypothetical protein
VGYFTQGESHEIVLYKFHVFKPPHAATDRWLRRTPHLKRTGAARLIGSTLSVATLAGRH